MTRNLKMLGLALAAMMVLGAASAQAAFAVEFHSENENTTVTAMADSGSIQEFTAAGHTIKCEEANFMATQTGTTAKSVTFQPAADGTTNAGFAKCTFLGINVTVNMHHCDFVFHGNGVIDISGENCYTKHQVEATEEGSVAEPIEFNASILGGLETCHVEIGTQSNLNGATYKEVGAGTNREITSEVNISNIKYTSTQSGGGCKAETTGEAGKYEGNQIATGETTGAEPEMVGIWTE